MAIDSTTELAQLAAGGAAGLLAVAVFAQKIISTWKGTQAENSIIGLMHTELERLSEQNSKLSTELGVLQTNIIELNQELRKLTTENQRLHAEVERLTAEVARLQAVLQQGGRDGSSS